MARLFSAVCLGAALLGTVACGKVYRPIGSYAPLVGEGGEAGQSRGPAPEPASNLDQLLPSSGCGQPLPARQVQTVPGERTGYTEWSLAQDGLSLNDSKAALPTTRDFLVRVPIDYDPNRPYRVVYLARGGCDAQSTYSASTYDLFDEAKGGSEQAVYVDMAVPNYDENPHCYDTTTGLDSLEYEAFDVLHDFVESHYCVDNNRIFVAGYSQGGALSNMYGCYFGGLPDPPRKFSPRWAIRGHAVVAGWREANQPVPCNGPGAGLWIHDAGDMNQGMYDSNTSSLMLALQTNDCTGNYDDGPKQPWAPVAGVPGLTGNACEVYTGCSSERLTDYPLVFCNAPGANAPGLGGSDRADVAIPAFTAFFETMDPKR